MTGPLVSVVVPVYLGQSMLAEALDSVAAQTYGAVEVIVVDDGSPDRCAEIARSRPEVRVVSQPHAGVAAARNTGVACAQGDLIAFLDQDDLWRARKLELQVELFAEHAEVSIALTMIEMVLAAGTPAPDWFDSSWLTGAPQRGFVPSTWLVRRSAFRLVGGFDTDFVIACDSDWLARAKDAGLRSVMLDEPLVQWRVHGANSSYDQDSMRRERAEMLVRTARRQRDAAAQTS